VFILEYLIYLNLFFILISTNLRVEPNQYLNSASLEEAILYVRSTKLDMVSWTMPHRDHWCSAGCRSKETQKTFDEEDQEALEILERSNIPHLVVDLSDCPLTFRMKAKFQGINKTPTLIAGSEKVKGLHEIMEFVSGRDKGE